MVGEVACAADEQAADYNAVDDGCTDKLHRAAALVCGGKDPGCLFVQHHSCDDRYKQHQQSGQVFSHGQCGFLPERGYRIAAQCGHGQRVQGAEYGIVNHLGAVCNEQQYDEQQAYGEAQFFGQEACQQADEPCVYGTEAHGEQEIGGEACKHEAMQQGFQPQQNEKPKCKACNGSVFICGGVGCVVIQWCASKGC